MKILITDFEGMKNFREGPDNPDNPGKWRKELDCYLGDGTFFSKNKPLFFNDYTEFVPFEFDTETDFFSMPYETYSFFVWKGEKPVSLEFEGQNSHGSASVFEVKEPGFITICAEDD